VIPACAAYLSLGFILFSPFFLGVAGIARVRLPTSSFFFFKAALALDSADWGFRAFLTGFGPPVVFHRQWASFLPAALFASLDAPFLPSVAAAALQLDDWFRVVVIFTLQHIFFNVIQL
jgi:hypothetical protein